VLCAGQHWNSLARGKWGTGNYLFRVAFALADGAETTFGQDNLSCLSEPDPSGTMFVPEIQAGGTLRCKERLTNDEWPTIHGCELQASGEI
jgi:hypothetical protein